jgi:hypothetical protein
MGCGSLTDYSEVYSLLFTGIIILFLFLTVYTVVANFEDKHELLLSSNLLTSKTVKHSRVLNESELVNGFFINLETEEIYGSLTGNLTSSLPFLLFKNEVFNIGRVVVSD